MATFGALSKEELLTCDERLQRVFNVVIKFFDCKIIEGHRGEALQRLYFKQGKTKVNWPDGKHNQIPSKGVDVMPCPINWFDKERMCFFAGFVMATAASMGIKLRWGKDWDMDTDLNDQTFKDGPHYEVVD
jgi:peptidoglycan L-alanyl-D-glutamate endopeptidase CwlK